MDQTIPAAKLSCSETRRGAPSLVTMLIGAILLLIVSYGEARFIERAPAWDGGAVVCPVDATRVANQGLTTPRRETGLPVAVLH